MNCQEKGAMGSAGLVIGLLGKNTMGWRRKPLWRCSKSRNDPYTTAQEEKP